MQASNDAAEYLFSTLLYRSFNLPIPECRIIEYSDPEYNIMLDALTFKTHNTELRKLIEYDFREKPFILMYEYYPHLTFLELQQAKSKSLLSYKKSERAREIFINLGKLIAMDMITNNPTRIPLILNHIGNPHLICLKMLSSYLLPNDNYKNPNFMNIFLDDTPVVANNMKSNTLDPKDKYQLKHLSDYRNMISDVLKQMFYEFRTVAIYGVNICSFEFKSLYRIKTFFLKTMGYDINSNNLFHLAMGIILLLDDFLRVDFVNILDLIEYIQKDAIYQDFGDTFYRSSFKLNFEYFKSIRDSFVILKDEYFDIFEYCRDNTFGIYSLNMLNSKSKQIQTINNSNVKNNNNVNIVPNVGNPMINVNQNKDNDPKINLLSTAELYFNNINRECDRYDELKYKPSATTKTVISNNKHADEPNKNSKIKQEPHDHFNYNSNDIFKYSNDVHNGLYDIVDIDTDFKNLILEWKDLNLHDGIDTTVPVMDIRSDEHPPEVKKRFAQNPQLLDHKVYTRDELKELITKKELKDTLNIKEELNPQEAELLKSIVIERDPELLEGRDYKGEKLGKQYEINKNLDKKLEKRLNRMLDEKKEKSQLDTLNQEKSLNEIKRKEDEETSNIKVNQSRKFFNKKSDK